MSEYSAVLIFGWNKLFNVENMDDVIEIPYQARYIASSVLPESVRIIDIVDVGDENVPYFGVVVDYVAENSYVIGAFCNLFKIKESTVYEVGQIVDEYASYLERVFNEFVTQHEIRLPRHWVHDPDLISVPDVLYMGKLLKIVSDHVGCDYDIEDARLYLVVKKV